MTDNNSLRESPLLAEILRELREIRERQDAIMKAQEDAKEKRGRIFRYLTRLQSAKYANRYPTRRTLATPGLLRAGIRGVRQEVAVGHGGSRHRRSVHESGVSGNP